MSPAAVRTARVVVLLLVGLLAGALPREASAGATKEDPTGNYSIEIPEFWKWLPESEGIVVGANRKLEKLQNGELATGQGALAQLSILDAPEGKTLDDLANDAQQRTWLLGRFGTDSTKWPVPVVKQDQVGPDDEARGPMVETRVIEVKGTANNLDGNPGEARGVLILAIVKKKLMRLRMYAWPTPHDEEGLKPDLDFIEINFGVLDTREEKKDGEGPPPDTEPEPAAKGDAGEEKKLEFLAQKIRMVKPKGIATKEDWKPEDNPNVVVWFEASEREGSYQILLYAYRSGATNAEGKVVADPDIRGWISSKWWEDFGPRHAAGKVFGLPWPRKPRKGTMVTLPVLDEKEAHVVFDEKDARPPEADFSEMEKKWRVVEKVKNGKIGPKVDANEAYRGAMQGARERVGQELVVRFAWKTATHSYEMIVSLAKPLYPKYEKPIRDLLESIELFEGK